MNTLKNFIPLLKRSFSDWNDDNAPRLGAALAFYTILSISPLMILVVAIVSLVFDRSSAQTHLLDQVGALMGPEGRSAVETMLASGQKASSGIFATLVGLITLVFGASGVFGELRSALNAIWEAKPQNTSGIWGMLRERFFSFGMVVSVGFVLLVSLLASTALGALTKFFSGLLPIPGFVLYVFNFLVSFLGIAILFAFILKYVPETKVEWSDVRIGAAVHDRQDAAGLVPGQGESRVGVWGGGIVGGDGDLGVLLGADLLLWGGVYACPCAGATRRAGSGQGESGLSSLSPPQLHRNSS